MYHDGAGILKVTADLPAPLLGEGHSQEDSQLR